MQTGGKTLAFVIASSMLSACGGGGGGTVGPTPPLVTTTFTSWRDPVAGKAIKIDGRGQEVSYTFDTNSRLITSITPPRDVSASAVFTFNDAGNLTGLFLTSGSTPVAAFDSLGISELVGHVGDRDSAGNPFFITAASTTSTAIMSNPKSIEWDYQSFGVWENGLDSTSGLHGVVSLGAPTAGSAIPGTGTANFTGKVVGSYVSAAGLGQTTVLAELNVGVDWGNQSLSFTTANTRTSTNGLDFVQNSGLNLTDPTKNVLRYQAGTNSFTGTLTTAGGLSGNSTGQFYGPNAVELGGVFVLQSSDPSNTRETYSGAYGARDVLAP